MSEKDDISLLDNVPIKALIERIRKTQVWKRDLASSKPKDDYTMKMWLEESGLTPGPHKIRAMIVYENYRDFCLSKKIGELSIVSLTVFGSYLKTERLFPKHVASDKSTYYHLNKDINTEAERERQKAKKDKQKAKRQLMGSKTPNIQ